MCSRHISKPQMVKQSLWMGGSESSSRPVFALLWAVAGTTVQAEMLNQGPLCYC